MMTLTKSSVAPENAAATALRHDQPRHRGTATGHSTSSGNAVSIEPEHETNERLVKQCKWYAEQGGYQFVCHRRGTYSVADFLGRKHVRNGSLLEALTFLEQGHTEYEEIGQFTCGEWCQFGRDRVTAYHEIGHTLIASSLDLTTTWVALANGACRRSYPIIWESLIANSSIGMSRHERANHDVEKDLGNCAGKEAEWLLVDAVKREQGVVLDSGEVTFASTNPRYIRLVRGAVRAELAGHWAEVSYLAERLLKMGALIFNPERCEMCVEAGYQTNFLWKDLDAAVESFPIPFPVRHNPINRGFDERFNEASEILNAEKERRRN